VSKINCNSELTVELVDVMGSDTSVARAAWITVRVKAPIMVFREWRRYRTQSYDEVSGRYSVLRPDFYVPSDLRPLVNIGTSVHPIMESSGNGVRYESISDIIISSYEGSWLAYQKLLEAGIANEVARLVLPVGIYSSMYVTANLSNWLPFLGLHTSEPNAINQRHPMWEIVQCAKQVEAIITEHFPLTMKLFDEQGRVAP
jgi:thymidylate synthase (FAD)